MAEAGKRRHFWPAVTLMAAVLYGVGFLAFVAALPRVPENLDQPDAIVALTGGGARLDTAVALFERGVGRRLLITGVNNTTTKAELKPIVHGGPRFECCADLGRTAANTHGNAAETAAWVKSHHYRRLIIVTASYHMPRALREFAAEMPGVRLEPYPVEPDGIDPAHWWRRPRTFRLLQSEYVKYLASLALTALLPARERDAIDPTLDPAVERHSDRSNAPAHPRS
ncbi:MAG: YdcF family protein [Alphaproteobacteria bacterium]|nr:YdcF family protein [Alphaproteobacteria bacterium]MDE2073236.1 YdcF family protein [Alphaproteobacteria bacterium]MDE2352677.1 YdcF family protein [Alphaproteobacteria bacterium]